MTAEELYEVTDILNDVLSNYLRGSEAEEVIAKLEESVEDSELIKESQLDSPDFKAALKKKVREAQDWTYIEEEGGSCPLYEEFGADDLEEFAEWGASWMRDQMMKDAVDGKIYETQARSKLKATTTGKISGLKYRVGDEVKMIIIKED
jgi:hypothetical protein